MRKILIIHNIITPTRTPLFNEINKYFSSKWYDFKVIFTSENESNRSWDINKELASQNFNYTLLKSKQIRTGIKDKFYFHINFWFLSLLDKENPDIIIHAWWASFSARESIFWCKKHKKQFILWNESSKYETSRRRTITKPIVKYLVKKSDWYLSFWTRATEYLIMLWADRKKICQIYNTVDIDFFLWESKKLESKKQELKERYWIKTKNVLLFVGQLIERKWIYKILEWFKNFQEKNKDWSLVFVWWWQEKEKMEEIIKREWIKNVYFPWFFQKNRISERYTIADIFTLPSREEVRWLVLNEAMCFWLPIITYYKVWSSPDLVKQAKNWYIMNDYSSWEFFNWLNFIISWNLINSNSSKEIINNFKVSNMVHKLWMFLN